LPKRVTTLEIILINCDQIYVGQTGRSFKIRYEEHIRDIRLNKDKSKYAMHMLQFSHEYGTIENILEILKAVNKGKLLDVLETYYIYIKLIGKSRL
jgi:hypothetical protein